MAKANQAPDAAVEDPKVDDAAEAGTAADVSPNADESVVKSGFRQIKIKDFRGSYGTAKFDDDGVAEVDDTTYEQLKKQFPGAHITELG